MSTKKGAEIPERKPGRNTRNQSSVEVNATANDGTEEANHANSGYPFDFAAMRTDIRDTVAAVVEDKLAVVTDKLDTIQTTLDGNTKRLEEAETRISDAEDILANIETRLGEAESKLAMLTRRMDDQESRMRRDNIRIFGVKEGVEGKDAIHFFETWLPTLLNMQTKKGRIRLDRCHRSLGTPRPGIPRAVIMKIHHSTDVTKVLALSKKTRLVFEGATVIIRQDLPQSVLQQRRKFNAVCQQLITKGIRFGMLYPANLRFSYKGKNFSFDSAEEAARLIETLDVPGV